MKEKIYTIPINEAYEEHCECPLCVLERRLEAEACEYAVGAAMMEADFRINSNEKGFCRHHMEKLFALPNKLSLALVLDTGVGDIGGRLKKMFDKLPEKGQGGIFKKDISSEICVQLCDELEKYENSCVICDKIDYTMDRYYGTLLDMWSTEEDFRKKFIGARAFCLPHLRAVLKKAQKQMSKKDLCAFMKAVGEQQKRDLEKLSNDVHRFTLKFDYRNRDMEWGDAKDAPRRAIEELCGYTTIEKDNA